MIDNKDWILLAVACTEENRMSAVQLQKSLFLLGKEQSTAVGIAFYEFRPYNYGPFSKQVYVDADELSDVGLLSISRRHGWAEYFLTPAGSDRAKHLRGLVDQQALSYLTRIANWVRRLTFEQLVKSIYAKYPEFKINSVMRD